MSMVSRAKISVVNTHHRENRWFGVERLLLFITVLFYSWRIKIHYLILTCKQNSLWALHDLASELNLNNVLSITSAMLNDDLGTSFALQQPSAAVSDLAKSKC